MPDAAEPALEALKRAHAAIRQRLVGLERTLDAMVNAGRATADQVTTLEAVTGYLRGAAAAHFAAEEEALLPPLERAVGRYGTLVNVIDYDHREVRRAVTKLGEAVEALRGSLDGSHKGPLEEANRHGLFLVQYLGLHMAKEEGALADLLRAHLEPADWRRAARILEAAASPEDADPGGASEGDG